MRNVIKFVLFFILVFLSIYYFSYVYSENYEENEENNENDIPTVSFPFKNLYDDKGKKLNIILLSAPFVKDNMKNYTKSIWQKV